MSRWVPESFLTIKTHLDFLDKGLINQFVHGNMYAVASSFCALVCSYLCLVFRSLFRRIFRFRQDERTEKSESGCGLSQFSEVDKRNGETEESVVLEAAPSVSCSKLQFFSGEDVKGFIEKPKILSFTVHEVFVDADTDISTMNTPVLDPRSLTYDGFEEIAFQDDGFEEKAGELVTGNISEEQEQKILTEEKSSGEEEVVIDSGFYVDFGNYESDSEASAVDNDSAKSLIIDEVLEKQEQQMSTQETISDEKDVVGVEDKCESDHDSLDDCQFVASYFTVPCDAEEEPVCSNDDFSKSNPETDPIGNQFLVDRTVLEAFGSQSPVFMHGDEVEEAAFRKDQSTDSDDDYIELEPRQQNSVSLNDEIFSWEDSSRVEEQQEQEESVHDDDAKPKADGLVKSEEAILQEKNCLSNADVHDETGFMLEHHDIIEQLKLELKQARTGGLPTIIEESESEEVETPKLDQKLKPLKIDETFEHKDLMEELQKVYKSYSDKMRKLDILNFQTMHALGLLRLTDTGQLKTVNKKSGLGIKSLLSQKNLWSSCKQRTSIVEPTKKIIVDMNHDFEMVYVGQLCLSWEILHWQYRKFQDVQRHNSSVSHRYNQVAGELQLFQVLLQRFVENEPFQGPRVQNYVKNRCVLRNLLQVPVIKDDNLKDKTQSGEDENPITSQVLEKIIEDSMRTFWEFLRADKDESNMVLQGHLHTLVNLKDSVDLQLFLEIRTDLQKKEKKLKDLLRCGNCIVKRLQKDQRDRRHLSLFIAQTELKLISRVVNMSKLTTEQLIWCHEKLDKINFSNRKVFVESSFLLFPC